MSRQWTIKGLSVTAAFCAAVFGLNSANSQSHKEDAPVGESDPPRTKPADTKILGGADRYQTAISTDKPIYRIGEKVYVRGVVLNAADHKPLSAKESTVAKIEVKGPKGDTVATAQTQINDSVWGYSWDVPDGQPGGEYKVVVSYPWTGHAPAERKFDVRAYRAPRLNSQITFMRDGYGPGEKVSATLDVKRAEGGVPSGAKVTVTALIDGTEIKGDNASVDENGLCSVSFNLPNEIPRGEGTLNMVIEDGGVVETASKTIPIILQTVDLQMFPEGGDLIAGYKNRVYLHAKQPNGKPADLKGKIVSEPESTFNQVTEFKTEHEGRGRFEFTPEKNKDYYLVVSEPAGIKKRFKLPEVKSEGAVIRTEKEVFAKEKPVTVQVGCTEKTYRVSLAKREVEIAAYVVKQDVNIGELKRVSFDVPSSVDGVLTVTVTGQDEMPLAERLVFRQPASPLKISITPDKKTHIPGDKTKLTIKTMNAAGKPVPAMVGLTVTDDSVLEMIEKREQAPHLPVMVYLEPEVEDLADAHVYLDPNNPKAPIATDLLLGTQGWRRFALMDLPKFIEAKGDQARRVVALKIVTPQFGGQQFAVRGGILPMVQMGAMPMGMPMNVKAGRPVAMPGDRLLAKDKNVAFFHARNQLQIIDDRPVIRDFRQAAVNGRIAADEISPLEGALARNEEAADMRIMGKARRQAGFFGGPFTPMVMVREYSHQQRPNRQPGDREDFTETVYWNSGVKTDAVTGEASVSFDLNDSVSTFRVFADGFDNGGAIGGTNIGIKSVQPFYAEAKMPLEVTAGDEIFLPISLVNSSGDALSNSDVKLDMKGDFELLSPLKASATIGVDQRVRWIQPIKVGAGNGSSEVVVNSRAGSYVDKVTRKLSVKPKGFPIESAFGGILTPGQAVVHNISIPVGVLKGSISTNSAVYPTPLANLTEALQRMIQDPNGCFEQTSATSYPLTMAQQYFLSHTGVDPKLVETSKQKLDAGYTKLVGFWCPDRGYEWFGENPGHEALTAFGLLHFADMAQVRQVDQAMIASTREWLMKQKDGKGGFTRKRRALHSWVEDKDCSNAYIVWALLESGQSPVDLKLELESLKNAATASNNSYVVALAANALHKAGNKEDAVKLMKRLAAKQKPDGSVDGITGSIVGSGGESLTVEGSSLATLAWMREPEYAGNVERSIKFLADSCKSGRYGSTQATVLALRAIVNYDKNAARPKAAGKVCVFVDGEQVGDWKPFSPSTQGSIKLPDISASLTPGDHKVELRMAGGGSMPYSLAVKYNALTPADSKECKLDLSVKIAQTKLVEGAGTEAAVTVTNKTDEVLPSPMAIVGLPGGLEPRHDQLKELVKKGTIDAYEVMGREVVLYWRTLPAAAKLQLPLSLVAAVPGHYTGPASRTYLYYTDEDKKWVDGVQVEIAAKQSNLSISSAK